MIDASTSPSRSLYRSSSSASDGGSLAMTTERPCSWRPSLKRPAESRRRTARTRGGPLPRPAVCGGGADGGGGGAVNEAVAAAPPGIVDGGGGGFTSSCSSGSRVGPPPSAVATAVAVAGPVSLAAWASCSAASFSISSRWASSGKREARRRCCAAALRSMAADSAADWALPAGAAPLDANIERSSCIIWKR